MIAIGYFAWDEEKIVKEKLVDKPQEEKVDMKK